MIAEIDIPTQAQFDTDILPAGQPVVMRGLVKDWPSVGATAVDLFASLKSYDSGAVQGTLIGQPDTAGRFHYSADLRSQNYDQIPETLSAGLDRLLNGPHPDGAYIQSIPLDVHMPNFARDHTLPLLPDTVVPRAWIGTPTTVQTHMDPSHNIACVLLGERDVTVFPPDQIAGLYPGPLETAPGGTLVSLTNLDAPDFAAHPKFKSALDTKLTTTLEPGDALYIPYGWWHHVRATADLNMLINYWFVPHQPRLSAPYAAMAMAMLSFDALDDNARAVWSGLFDYFVFGRNGDPMAHVPDAARGILGGIPAGREAEVIHDLLAVLGPAIGLNPPPRN